MIFSPYTVISLESTPMGDELKWLLKEGGGCIFENCDISLENTPTSHAVSLALFVWACSDSAICLLSALAYAITTNGACLHLLVPPLAQCCFFGASCLT